MRHAQVGGLQFRKDVLEQVVRKHPQAPSLHLRVPLPRYKPAGVRLYAERGRHPASLLTLNRTSPELALDTDGGEAAANERCNGELMTALRCSCSIQYRHPVVRVAQRAAKA